MITYKGHPVTLYNYYHVYHKDDYVTLDNTLFRSVSDFNVKRNPWTSFNWEKIGKINNNEIEKKPETTVKINNNTIGDITANNVVIYGHHTGYISAQGEKAVVVIFGNVTGNVKANQVIYVKDDKRKTN